MARPKKDEIGKIGETKFREYCDNSKFAYLFIEQGRETLSSELWKLKEKRPDFLVTIPAVGSLLFDVKTQTKFIYYKDFKEVKRKQWAFSVNYKDFKKLERLQDQTGLKVWYAFFEMDDDYKIEDKCLSIPLSNIRNFEFKSHRDGGWSFIQVPFDCLAIGKGKINIENICNECGKKICDDTRKVLGQ